MRARVCVCACVRVYVPFALAGIRLKDKYLVLQIHNPKRMLQLGGSMRKGEKGQQMSAGKRPVEKPGEGDGNMEDDEDEGAGDSEEESGAEGTFLHMVSAVCKVSR